jgi:hypothetical protein
MEAQNLTEAVRKRAAAAEAAATQSEQGHDGAFSSLGDTRLWRVAFCDAHAGGRGLWPTRRQRRHQGISDYAPAGDAGSPVQGSSRGLTA